MQLNLAAIAQSHPTDLLSCMHHFVVMTMRLASSPSNDNQDVSLFVDAPALHTHSLIKINIFIAPHEIHGRAGAELKFCPAFETALRDTTHQISDSSLA